MSTVYDAENEISYVKRPQMRKIICLNNTSHQELSTLHSFIMQIVLGLCPSVKALYRTGYLCPDCLSHGDVPHPCSEVLWKLRWPHVLMSAPWCIDPVEISVGTVIEEITRLHYLWRSSGLTVHYAIWKQHVVGYQRPWQLQRTTSFSNITALRGENVSFLGSSGSLIWLRDCKEGLQIKRYQRLVCELFCEQSTDHWSQFPFCF